MASSVLATPARAEASVQLGYRAPEECPSQTGFVAAVASRGGRFDTAEASSRLRSVDISIQKGAQGLEGSLRLEDSAGASTVRQVHAGQCSEVVNGLAIVTAIALSGDTRTSAVEPAKPASEPLATPAKRTSAAAQRRRRHRPTSRSRASA